MSAHPLVLATGLLLAWLPASVSAQQTSENPPRGKWESPFQHDMTGFPADVERFNAVHMSLIPKGQHRGKVMVFDLGADDTLPEWRQRWSIVNPRSHAPEFVNRELVLPADEGDFFCAGHAWSADGNLFVAGGTSRYPSFKRTLHPDGPGFDGGKMAYFWDPAVGAVGEWIRKDDMVVDRWYPTVLKLADGTLLSAGGTDTIPEHPFTFSHYEVFHLTGPTEGQWVDHDGERLFDGPGGYGTFTIYPRLFQLSSGEQFLAGMTGYATRMNHLAAPGQWNRLRQAAWSFRSYATSVLLPLRPDASGDYVDEVMTLGGFAVNWDLLRSIEDGKPYLALGGIVSTVETCRPGSPMEAQRNWKTTASLNHRRTVANAVILADGTLMVVGGRVAGDDVNERPIFVPELFDGEKWLDLPPQASALTYHSTALLLPNGKVLAAGGNTGTWDYQVFAPGYLLSGHPRPIVTSAPGKLEYQARVAQGVLGHQKRSPRTYAIQFAPMPPGESVEHAVLVSPGSVTHHTDVNQRYIELLTTRVTDTDITVQAPRDGNLVPPGYYMLFLLSAKGVPSKAAWVLVE